MVCFDGLIRYIGLMNIENLIVSMLGTNFVQVYEIHHRKPLAARRTTCLAESG